MNEHDFDGDRPRQLLVCTFGEDCARKLKQRDGNPHALGDALKAARTDAGLKRQLYVTKTGCQGWCEQAPVAQLLPEGRLFKDLTVEGAAADVRACMQGGASMADRLIWDYGLTRAENQKRQTGA